MESSELNVPLPQLPSDALRKGLTTFQDRLIEQHPVQRLQEEDAQVQRYETLKGIYGAALPARMHIEHQILSKRGRLAPLPSSNFGSDVYFGDLGTFGVESYLGLEADSERLPVDMHSAMEQQLKLDTQSMKRGIL